MRFFQVLHQAACFYLSPKDLNRSMPHCIRHFCIFYNDTANIRIRQCCLSLHCAHTGHSVIKAGSHKTFQCQACRRQQRSSRVTLFQSTKLPLTAWFLAIYLISQAKTGLSALALIRYLGVISLRMVHSAQAHGIHVRARNALYP